MDEHHILATLREHVARSQGNDSVVRRGAAPEPAKEARRVDLSRLEHYSAELRRLRNNVGQLNPRNAGLFNRAVQEFKKLLRRSLSWYTRSLNEYHDVVNHAIEYHARAIAAMQQQLAQQGGGLPEALQESLRTARRATQEQLAPYAPLFRGAEPVLELGCGGGEFLELLKHQGVAAYGVDSDRLACEEARARSLKVVQADLMEHLAQVPERSVGGIFCSRVIEYLPEHRQQELIERCCAALKPSGLLVLETLNPDSDVPYGRNSHIDPTHLRAVYPEILRAMLQGGGFDDCRICVLAPQPVLAGAAAAADVSLGDTGAGSWLPPGLSRAPAYAAIAHRR